jgi:6-phosphogluconate dehydrogenase (decarboxylating)
MAKKQNKKVVEPIEAEVTEVQEMPIEDVENNGDAPVISFAVHVAGDGRWAIQNLKNEEESPLDARQLTAVIKIVHEELQTNELADKIMARIRQGLGGQQ